MKRSNAKASVEKVKDKSDSDKSDEEDDKSSEKDSHSSNDWNGIILKMIIIWIDYNIR